VLLHHGQILGGLDPHALTSSTSSATRRSRGEVHGPSSLRRTCGTAGLSDAEANELGRLMAEKSGETYGGAAAGKAAFDVAEAEEQRLREHRGE
jgi:hypothetical protein